MDEQEAQALLYVIAEDAPRLSAMIHRIGNGDYVIIVKGVWLWEPADWERLRGKLLGAPSL